ATGGQGYDLFPPEGTVWWQLLKQTLLLQIGPHQFQVMGLYVLVIAGAPAVLWGLHRGYWRGVLCVSLTVYLLNLWFGSPHQSSFRQRLIWIEHVVHALMSVAKRLVVVDFGRKVTEGDPSAVMASAAVKSIYMGEDAGV
ncbi:MAG: hypothetical protein EBU97_02885, partial [Rhodobacteraceae bacterium]|nr:hypothetical protein [Paracoccaceae bacterium]